MHIHSTASDGTATPAQIVREALARNMSVIALTDHDSVEGIAPGLRAATGSPLRIIPAVELSSDLGGRDVHFLGYFIDFQAPWFREHLSVLRSQRFERARKMVRRLREAGVDVPMGEVLNTAGNGSVGRSHVASVMLRRGYIDSIGEAFERYIGRQAFCYVEKYHYPCEFVIDLIRRVGGIAVLAHPGLSQVDEHLGGFVAQGLGGIEAYHSAHSGRDTARYLAIGEELGLVVTGGSDSHGQDSDRGVLIGAVEVPDTVVRVLDSARLDRARCLGDATSENTGDKVG